MKEKENLINAMIEYGLSSFWDDSYIINRLEDCGITEEDFIENGYGNFVKEYYNT